jgi:hypothetical protein
LDFSMKDLCASRRKAPSLAPQISIVFAAIDRLKPGPTDWRRRRKKQIWQISNKIETLGFVVSIVTDRDGNVIACHGWPLAAGELGMAEMPTLCLDHLTQAQTGHAATGRPFDDLAREAEAANVV